MTLLEIEGLEASYGVTKALFGVNLRIAEGEVTALMGRNGTGKSTTVKCVCRMLPARGTLRFGGRDLHRLPSHRAARLGLGLVPEGRRCFRDLTVTENLVAAARPGPWDMATTTALFPRLAERRGQRAGTLSGGEQQMLAVGRALMTNPRLLILDEATEGLAPLIRQEIWAAVAAIKRDTGTAILVIDKAIAELRRVCDSATILERGTTAWAGPMAELTPETTERLVGV